MYGKLSLIYFAILGLCCGALQTSFKNGIKKAFINSYPESTPYIVGGEIVQGREFPSIVSLRVNGSHECGGSILNPEWILTAAHCCDIKQEWAKVVAGTNLLNGKGDEYNVVEIYYHRNFSIATSYNDIAVWKVSPPIVLNEGVGLVNLPEKDQDTPPGKIATVTGWGETQVGGPISNELRKVDVKISDNDKCNSTYAHHISKTQICAGLEEGGKDACMGDSGGPLYVDGEIVGIVSWGKPCAHEGYPTVYTRVAKYIDWIGEHTK